jgi:hypothetical protein
MSPFGYVDTTFAVRASAGGKEGIAESCAGVETDWFKVWVVRYMISLTGGEPP